VRGAKEGAELCGCWVRCEEAIPGVDALEEQDAEGLGEGTVEDDVLLGMKVEVVLGPAR